MRKIILILLLFFPTLLLASETVAPSGIGAVAQGLLQPVNVAADFIGSAAIIIGATLLFSALLKYMQHRVNPLASPISTIVVLIILGIILILLPLSYRFTEGGWRAAYSFFT